ncbi:MAG: ABC transporter substrate-binding protein [Deltaproteobacteria bacterium]|nr:ABC transporter substrate-binding protein [Deltaproteobacteria bacterium]MDZ4341002.1 ABC transporter substrate-binding protein [Candidatus Binatia bacterium]
MEKLFLTLACGDYDRTHPLQTGEVEAEGIKLNYIALQSEEAFWRMGHHQEFDASEMSLSNYTTMVSRGNPPFVGVPVFPSRYFRHSSIFFNVDSGIKEPKDLKGKKIGTPEYAMTAAVWIRGMLNDDFGVRTQDMEWFLGGQEDPGRKERLKLQLPPEIRVQSIPEDKTLNGMLESGELDGLISARIPSCLAKGSTKVRRLFPNYRDVEIDYYKRTKIFPIMHILVVRREVYEKHPWVARSLYKAFCEAKDRAFQIMHISNSHAVMMPWLAWEREQLKELFGPDWWPYGIEPNRHVIETLIRYMGEQGLLAKPVSVEDLFAPNVIGEFKL